MEIDVQKETRGSTLFGDNVPVFQGRVGEQQYPCLIKTDVGTHHHVYVTYGWTLSD